MAPTLLIVEDDPALAELLVWSFEAEGYKVLQTPDGEEALLIAAETPPDAIILDWMIEQLSGIEVCRRLRRHQIGKWSAPLCLSPRLRRHHILWFHPR